MWTVLVFLGCAGSLQLVLPAMGSYNYAVVGIIGGQITALVAARKLRDEHVGGPIVAGLSLLAGALGGVFWPVAATLGLSKLISGDGGGGHARPAVA
jgi:hypothetical protein